MQKSSQHSLSAASAPIEQHPLAPFLPVNAKLLMLGSFPPPRSRWKMDFYYPNLQNDMWRIFGLIFFGNKQYFLTPDGKGFRQPVIEAFLNEQGIAIYDSASAVRRLQGNASDKFLEIAETINLAALLEKIPDCRHIITTGEKAADTLLTLLPPETEKPAIGKNTAVHFAGWQLTLHRLPSSSRAYPLALEKKAAAYAEALTVMGFDLPTRASVYY